MYLVIVRRKAAEFQLALRWRFPDVNLAVLLIYNTSHSQLICFSRLPHSRAFHFIVIRGGRGWVGWLKPLTLVKSYQMNNKFDFFLDFEAFRIWHQIQSNQAPGMRQSRDNESRLQFGINRFTTLAPRRHMIPNYTSQQQHVVHRSLTAYCLLDEAIMSHCGLHSGVRFR